MTGLISLLLEAAHFDANLHCKICCVFGTIAFCTYLLQKSYFYIKNCDCSLLC